MLQLRTNRDLDTLIGIVSGPYTVQRQTNRRHNYIRNKSETYEWNFGSEAVIGIFGRAKGDLQVKESIVSDESLNHTTFFGVCIVLIQSYDSMPCNQKPFRILHGNAKQLSNYRSSFFTVSFSDAEACFYNSCTFSIALRHK